ncbi:hypothetical protein HXX01_03860 [Candidatus Nomurabacteria bacterium]|nr:hypothetical protein [Candidatus Nomurabacteria bacterium]
MYLKFVLILIVFCLGCTVVQAAPKKASGDNIPSDKFPSDKTLIKEWDKDKSITRLTDTGDTVIYGVVDTYKEGPDGFITFWTKTLNLASMRAGLKGKLKNTLWKMMKWEFDCNSNKLYISKSLAYNGKGSVIESFEPDIIWNDAIPQSIGEYMLQIACQTKSRSSTAEEAQEIPEGAGVKGRTLEVLQSGGYTYALVLLENDKTKWIALPEIKLNVGVKIEFPDTPPLKDFTSKTLNKHFDEISFTPGVRIYK